MSSEWFDVLRQVRLLADVSDATLEELATRAHVVEVAAGQTIFEQGAEADALYVIASGTVRIDVLVDIEEPLPATLSLVTLRSPEDFGSLALIDDEPRSASAVADSDCTLIALFRKDVRSILARPEPARAMLRALAGVVRRMNLRLGDAAFGSVAALAARAILGFGQRFGEDTPDGLRIAHPMTLDDLAREAGLLPSDLRWIIVNWEFDNVLEPEEGAWLVRRPEVLRSTVNRYRPNPVAAFVVESDDAPVPTRAPDPDERPGVGAIAEDLARTPLFAGLPRSSLDALAGLCQIRAYAAGATIFDEGQAGNALYIVHTGEVRIHMSSPTKQPINLLTVRAPRAFGELALLDGGPRSAGAVAEAPTQLIALYREDFLALLESQPAAADAVLRAVTGIIRDMNVRFSDVALLDRRGRVCKALLAFVERYGRETDEGWLIEHPMSSEDLAAEAGLYGVEVQRIIRGEFEPDHQIEHRIDSWLVRDLSVLESCARRYR